VSDDQPSRDAELLDAHSELLPELLYELLPELLRGPRKLALGMTPGLVPAARPE
jgi:hypothetical protein